MVQKVSQVNFQGQFLCEELKPKHAKKLREILTAQYNGVSGEQYLKDMPFDILVVPLNYSKKTIHPRFNFWMKYTKKDATIQGCIKINSKEKDETNAQKLINFITEAYKKAKSLKGNEKLSPKEELQRQVDLMLFG